MDNLGRLLLFRDVVEAGGFSRAAQRRGVRHSTVSKQLSSLEAELGVLLLNRTSRSMSLTEEGRLVLEYSRRLGTDVAELQERLAGLAGEGSLGELRVSCLLHLARHLVLPAIRSYQRAHPRAVVRLTSDDGRLHFNRDGLDVAVRVGRAVEGSLTARKLLTNEVCIVAAPALVERMESPTHPSMLQRLPTVGYAGEVEITAWAYRDRGAVRTVRVDPVCYASDGNSLLDMVLAGIGIGYVSRFAALPDLRAGRLVQLLPGFKLPPYEPVYTIHATSPHVPRKVRVFERHLRAVVRELTQQGQ